MTVPILPVSPSSPSPATQANVSVIALTFWTLASLVLMGGTLSAMMMLMERAEWWPAFLASAGIGLASALAGILPVVFVAGRRQPTVLPMAFLAGMMLRMMAFLALLLVATKQLGTPPQATAMMSLAFVVAAIVAEVFVLVRSLSRTPKIARPSSRTPSTEASNRFGSNA